MVCLCHKSETRQKSENHSHSQVKASVSFSICAYRSSVLDNDREIYETGFTAPSLSLPILTKEWVLARG